MVAGQRRRWFACAAHEGEERKREERERRRRKRGRAPV
jgi:hypothetical protein